MISDLSVTVLGYIEKHPGTKLVELQQVLRKPPQEVEAAVSQLNRLGRIRQNPPGYWNAVANPPQRSERELEHARIEVPAARPAQPVDPPAVMSAGQPASTDQEQPMGTRKKCTKCGIEKGAQAFSGGGSTCRKCVGGKAAAPKPAKKRKMGTARKLKAIVRRHGTRPASHWDATRADLVAERERIDQAIAALDACRP